MSERLKGYNPEKEEPIEIGVGKDSQGRPAIGGTPKGLRQLNKMYPEETPIIKIINQIRNSKNN